jgi:hypothetical protein
MPIDDESNWQVIHNGFHLQADENQGMEILIPGTFTQHTIRVYAISLVAKPHWWLAGALSQLLGSNNKPVFEGSRWRVPLSKIMLIKLPELTTNYRLRFEVPRWHKEIALVVEIYTGE